MGATWWSPRAVSMRIFFGGVFGSGSLVMWFA
jgi:hypothetical protein